MDIEKIDNYINSHYLLYKYDIRGVIYKIFSMNKITNINELEKVIKFLESIFYLIDYEILDNNTINELSNDMTFTPRPSLYRVIIINNILDYNLINFNFLFEKIDLDKIEMFTLKSFEEMQKTKTGIDKLNSRSFFVGNLVYYYNIILSKLCYIQLHRLVSAHFLDLKENGLKTAYRFCNLKKDKKIQTIFYNMFEVSKLEKKLIYCYNETYNYDFNDKKNGVAWKNIYNKIKEALL